MIDKKNYLLWLGGIYDQSSLNKFKSISAAANLWQSGLVNELTCKGALIYLLAYPSERVWPFGKLFISSSDGNLKSNINGRLVGYINLPYIRFLVQFYFLKNAAIKWLRNLIKLPDYVIVFSTLSDRVKTTPSIEVARYLRSNHDIPWVCIVADGQPPDGADRYVFLAWSTYLEFNEKHKAIHMDGGVVAHNTPTVCNQKSPKAFMYMGSLLMHGGAVELTSAFTKIKNDDIELWLCGQGINQQLINLAKFDPRIKLMGFLPEEKLNELASKSFAFVNPRPFSFAANRVNYPSKILHYLSFSKPILSTITDGLHPEYAEFLVPIRSESIRDIQDAIQTVLDMSKWEYESIVNRIKLFCLTHCWDKQADKFLNLLK